MPIRCTCPGCDAALKLPQAPPAGKLIKCPKCGQRFPVNEAAGKHTPLTSGEDLFQDAPEIETATQVGEKRKPAARAEKPAPRRRPPRDEDDEDRELDEDEAPPRKRKGSRRDRDEDDDVDEDEDRPRRKRKKLEPVSAAWQAYRIGRIVVLVIVIVVAAVVWIRRLTVVPVSSVVVERAAVDPTGGNPAFQPLAKRLVGSWHSTLPDGGSVDHDYRMDGSFNIDVHRGQAISYAGTWKVVVIGKDSMAIERTGPTTPNPFFEPGTRATILFEGDNSIQHQIPGNTMLMATRRAP